MSPSDSHWQRIGFKHHHGINIPLFSLRTNNSSGIGEFNDLLPLVDWCQANKLDVIQLLPLNDSGLDPSPYNALSAFALSPIYICLKALPNVEKHTQLASLLNDLKKLDQAQTIDYPQLFKLKDRFLRAYAHLEGEKIVHSEPFKAFVQKQKGWLAGYSLFKALKIKNLWKSWEDWPEKSPLKNPEAFQKLSTQYESEIQFHSYCQFLAYQQLAAVKTYANQKGIWIKGDIPIQISRDSADVWLNPELFQLQYSAGAPPDYYAKEGQNWGFPIYNWEQLEKENYRWWRSRLKTAEPIYDLYRIDHVVGFFRIWAIPLGKKAREGSFIPQDERVWIDHGKKIMLMMLEASSMLPIAEDLGTVPPAVRACLQELGICGTKVMRWERMWEEDSRFIPYYDYPLESMTTVSTHDSETVRMWWFNQPQEAKDFAQFKGWRYTTELSQENHRQILWDSHRTRSLFHINLLPEYLMQFRELSWANPADERINVPGTITPKNWAYRLRPNLETILKHDRLADLMTDLIPA